MAAFEDPSILNNLHSNPFVNNLYAKSSYLTISFPTSNNPFSPFNTANNTENASSLHVYSFVILVI